MHCNFTSFTSSKLILYAPVNYVYFVTDSIVVILECTNGSWASSCGADDTRRGKTANGTKWTEGWCDWLNKTGAD